MTIELINVGRNKVNKIVSVKNEKAMWKEITSHLMSKDIELFETDTENKYTIIVGGMRSVGEIIINN